MCHAKHRFARTISHPYPFRPALLQEIVNISYCEERTNLHVGILRLGVRHLNIGFEMDACLIWEWKDCFLLTEICII